MSQIFVDILLNGATSDEKFEQYILEYGINNNFNTSCTLFQFLMWFENRRKLTYNKIDILFKHDPIFYTIERNKLEKYDYLKFHPSIWIERYFRNDDDLKKELYFALRLLQSMNLRSINNTKIVYHYFDFSYNYSSEINYSFEYFSEYDYRNISTKIPVCAYNFLNWVLNNGRTKTFGRYCEYIYFPLTLLFYNEVTRKKTLSDIIFEKLIK